MTRFPSSSVNCSSITDSPGMFLASSPWGEGLNTDGGIVRDKRVGSMRRERVHVGLSMRFMHFQKDLSLPVTTALQSLYMHNQGNSDYYLCAISLLECKID